jgi:long-chain acyl-CoA synthetase
MSDSFEDLIYLEKAISLHGLFRMRVQRSANRPAYRSFNKESNEWEDTTWTEMGTEVDRWHQALASEGLKPGDRVALSLRNCKEWVVFEQAVLSMGLVVIPLYTDDRPDNIAYIINDAAVRLLLAQDGGRWNKLASALSTEKAPSLKKIIILNNEKNALHDERVVMAGDWIPENTIPVTPYPSKPDDLATIVYTSGTTGRPKGVMLSHSNILSVAHSALTMVAIYPKDLFLSFLPLSHTLERTAGYYLPMMAGSTVAYSRSITQLADDLATVKPTILIAVPRIFEKIHGRITQQLETGSALKKLLFNAAVNIGWHRFEKQQGRRGWGPCLLFWPLLKRLVGDKVLAKLGGNLRLVVSGGAPLSPAIARTFIGLGLPLLQGYGLTETSPVISCNLPEDNEPASVGVTLRGMEVRIGEHDELEVHSPGVMLGYWNNHTATAAMIDNNGWLKTGDQARIEKGHIYITGRLKDILVLSNGEKVPPGDMENAICLDPLFEQVMIVGEGKSFLGALIVLNGDLWPGVAQDLGLDPMSRESLTNKKVIAMVMRRIAALLHDFPSYAKIRKVFLTLEPWTIDNGLLTPTMKIKRAKVLEYLNNEVEALYK